MHAALIVGGAHGWLQPKSSALHRRLRSGVDGMDDDSMDDGVEQIKPPFTQKNAPEEDKDAPEEDEDEDEEDDSKMIDMGEISEEQRRKYFCPHF